MTHCVCVRAWSVFLTKAMGFPIEHFSFFLFFFRKIWRININEVYITTFCRSLLLLLFIYASQITIQFIFWNFFCWIICLVCYYTAVRSSNAYFILLFCNKIELFVLWCYVVSFVCHFTQPLNLWFYFSLEL